MQNSDRNIQKHQDVGRHEWLAIYLRADISVQISAAASLQAPSTTEPVEHTFTKNLFNSMPSIFVDSIFGFIPRLQFFDVHFIDIFLHLLLFFSVLRLLCCLHFLLFHPSRSQPAVGLSAPEQNEDGKFE